ncbi:MAG TPA: toll/interleukin-1 receptor domain-containing protein [Thermoanaerobaculia bacterium]
MQDNYKLSYRQDIQVNSSHYDVFLSHNRKQKNWVRELAKFLRTQGLTVFFDEEDIRPGEDIIEALERAVESSKSLVLILSMSSVCSHWVSFETAMRVYTDVEGGRKTLIPIMVEKIDHSLVRLSMRRLDYVDLTDPETREFEFSQFLSCIGIPTEKVSLIKSWPEPSGIEPLFVADVNSIISRGWDGPKLLDELIKLDYSVIEGLIPDHEGQSSQWAPVFMDHPDTWRLITNSSKDIVGYWHFVPLFEDEYERARAGVLIDSEITTDKVRIFELPGQYDIYFVSIGILPKYRRSRAVTLLINSILDVLVELAQQGIFIRQLCANAYTPSGEALCKSLGMSYLRPHKDKGKIYCANLSDLLSFDILIERQELRRLYKVAAQNNS